MLPVAVLLMVKNEEDCIQTTIDSIKDYISTVIIYDTGSTDNTLSIIQNTCRKNGQSVYIKTTDSFKNFAESRNEAIEFAETVNVNILLLMDAGDELRCLLSKDEFIKYVSTIPSENKHGIINLSWLENGVLTEHYDIRLIKNSRGCRYNIDYPVHEQFQGIEKNVFPIKFFYLYQNRDIYGGKTQHRLKRDIELLLAAKMCKHNCYHLAQSYMAVDDLKNGYKYNLLTLEQTDDIHGSIDNNVVYSRVAYCALMTNMEQSIIIKYLKLAIDSSDCKLLEPYVNLLKYCVNNNISGIAEPYLEKISQLEKKDSLRVNNEEYDYMRWYLIARICLMSKCKFELGKLACKKAISVHNKKEDIAMLRELEAGEPTVPSNSTTKLLNKVEVATQPPTPAPPSLMKDSLFSSPHSVGTIHSSNKSNIEGVSNKIGTIYSSASKPHVDISKDTYISSSQREGGAGRTVGSPALGALIMVRNEEESIAATINSTKYYIDHIIVYDTGSTDNTINIIKSICEQTGQNLYLKAVDKFKTFPESRNESIEFAETVDVEYLVMMDSGDEFRTNISKQELHENIRMIPKEYRYGLVKQEWGETMNSNIVHTNIRFYKNRAGCRYSMDYLIHEKFKFRPNENPLEFSNMFCLFQNRGLYGQKSSLRQSYDIEMLLKSKKCSRNYFFLAQTYMDMGDFENGYKYNVAASEIGYDDDNIDLESIYTRVLFCAIDRNKDRDLISKYFKLAIDNPSPNDYPCIDAYIYFLHYCIKVKDFDSALPLLEPLSKLKPVKCLKTVNRNFYEYERWFLISVICLMSKTNMAFGKEACLKAIEARGKMEDKHNLQFF